MSLWSDDVSVVFSGEIEALAIEDERARNAKVEKPKVSTLSSSFGQFYFKLVIVR